MEVVPAVVGMMTEFAVVVDVLAAPVKIAVLAKSFRELVVVD